MAAGGGKPSPEVESILKTGTLQLDGDLELGVVSLFGGSIGKAANYLLQQRKSGETETNRQALADVGCGMAAGAGESIVNGRLVIDPIGAENDVINSAIGGAAGEFGTISKSVNGKNIGPKGGFKAPLPDIPQNTNNGKADWSGLTELPNANLAANSGNIRTIMPEGIGGTPNE